MAKLKEIRLRIASIKSTRQVTSAMKMVSAAKLKKAQDQIFRLEPYHNKLHEIVGNIKLADTDHQNPFLVQREIKKVLVVAVGSNRGLCGGFNTNVVKKALWHVYSSYPELLKNGNVFFLPISKLVEKDLLLKGAHTIGNENDIAYYFNYDDIVELSNKLNSLFLSNQYQRIDIVYNKFKNTANQEVYIEQYLPLSGESTDNSGYSLSSDFIFEPSKETILTSLLPQWLNLQLYRICIDSNAAEQSARMLSMTTATDNADELIIDLQIMYNNARQACITNEIVEISSGAEALKG